MTRTCMLHFCKGKLSLTSCHSRVVTHELSLTSCHSRVFTHELSLTSFHSRVVTHELSLTSCHSRVVTHELSLTSCHSRRSFMDLWLLWYIYMQGVAKKGAPHQKRFTWIIMATNKKNVDKSYVFVLL